MGETHRDPARLPFHLGTSAAPTGRRTIRGRGRVRTDAASCGRKRCRAHRAGARLVPTRVGLIELRGDAAADRATYLVRIDPQVLRRLDKPGQRGVRSLPVGMAQDRLDGRRLTAGEVHRGGRRCRQCRAVLLGGGAIGAHERVGAGRIIGSRHEHRITHGRRPGSSEVREGGHPVAIVALTGHGQMVQGPHRHVRAEGRGRVSEQWRVAGSDVAVERFRQRIEAVRQLLARTRRQRCPFEHRRGTEVGQRLSR